MRSGFVALVGRPNVGKSTLMNAIVGEKVAITTPVPQTTRHAIRGVLHRPAAEASDDDLQIVFVDTPGVHKPRTVLGSRLNDVARRTLTDVDCIVLLVDGAAGIGRGDEFLAELVGAVDTATVAVVNKIDRLTREAQLPALARLDELGDWAEIVPLSAATGDGVDTLTEVVAARMPEGPPYFPAGQVSDQPLEQVVAEIIREKAITAMREEVPHSIAVTVDEIAPGETPEEVTVITAVVFVERDSQKGIVIGEGGRTLRDIGSRARHELELLMGARVHLDVRVKLAKEWQRDPKALQRLGY